MGVPLYRIPDVRRMYGKDPAGVDAIDFEEDQQVPPLGHVVAVRVTSEDANDGFKPTCGNIDELSFRTSPEVWGYFSVKSGGGIHEFSDSQFGHLFAKGETREAAIRSMVVALKEVKIRGEIRTIVDYASEMIQSPDFVGNEVHTGWLDSRIARHVRAEKPAWYLAVIAGALLRCLDEVAAVSGEYLGYLEKGQLPPAKLTLTKFDTAFVLDGMKYEPRVVRKGPQAFTVFLGSGPRPTSVDVVARRLNDGEMVFFSEFFFLLLKFLLFLSAPEKSSPHAQKKSCLPPHLPFARSPSPPKPFFLFQAGSSSRSTGGPTSFTRRRRRRARA